MLNKLKYFPISLEIKKSRINKNNIMLKIKNLILTIQLKLYKIQSYNKLMKLTIIINSTILLAKSTELKVPRIIKINHYKTKKDFMKLKYNNKS